METPKATLPNTTGDGEYASRPPDDTVREAAFLPHGGSPTKWRYVTPIALVILVMLVFVSALAAGFVYWDDDDLLINNTRYQVLNTENLQWMFSTSYAGHFQPLAQG